MAVAVVIIDIRASVEHVDLAPELKRLAQSLEAEVPGSMFQVAWGDEVEGVLPRPADTWDLYLHVRKTLGDLGFYMGVGFGEISGGSSGIAGQSVHDLNGTAFKAAREAVEAAKADTEAALALEFSVFGQPELTAALSAYPRIINLAARRMTRTQRAYFSDLIVGYRQSAIARRHGVRQPSVSLALQRAGADQLDAMAGGLRALLAFVAAYTHWGGGEAGR